MFKITHGTVKTRQLVFNFLAGTIGLFTFILIWWIISLFTPSYLLPNPLAVLRKFGELISTGELFTDLFQTTWVSVVGLIIAALVAIGFAIIFVISPIVEKHIYPIVIAMRSIPAIAVAPLLMIWTGVGLFTQLMVVSFVAFFPILVYLMHGLRSPSADYWDQFTLWSASKIQRLLYLRIPWAIPSFFASLKVAVTYALIGSFVAEMTGAKNGLGRLVFNAYYHFDTPTVMVGIICFASLGLIMFYILNILETRVLKSLHYSIGDSYEI